MRDQISLQSAGYPEQRVLPFDLEPDRFEILKEGTFPALLARRLSHAMPHHSPTLRPSRLFEGELEALILDPLYSISIEIMTGSENINKRTYYDGLVRDLLVLEAKKLTALAELMAKGGWKTVQASLADILITGSPAVSAFYPDNEVFRIVRDKKEGERRITVPGKGVVTVKFVDNMSALFAAIGSQPVVNVEYQPVGSRAYKDLPVYTSTQVSPLTVEDYVKKVMANAGKGPGAQQGNAHFLSSMKKRNYIERTIDYLLASPQSFVTDGDASFKRDGVSLAFAYAVYSHVTRSFESYDAVAPAMGESRDPNSLISATERMARRVAWFFAAACEAGTVMDMSLLLYMVDSAISFIKPAVLDADLLQAVESNAAKLRATLEPFKTSALQPLFNDIITELKASHAADVLLPPWMESVLPTRATLPTNVKLAPDFAGFDLSAYPSNRMPQGLIHMCLQTINDHIEAGRLVADAFSSVLSTYLTSLLPYDPNAFNVPGDLFAIENKFATKAPLEYYSHYDCGKVVQGLPRYKFDPKKRTYRPALTPYVNASVHAQALAYVESAKEGIFTWPYNSAIPLFRQTAAHFIQAPLPSCYIEDTSVNYSFNDARALETRLASLAGPFSGLQGRYLKDAVALMKKDPTTGAVIASLFSAFGFFYSLGTHAKGLADVKQKDMTWVKPSIPTVYGMPTSLLEAVQPRPFVGGKWDTMQAIVVTLNPKEFQPADLEVMKDLVNIFDHSLLTAKYEDEAEYYAFVPHKYLPEPTEFTTVPFELDASVIINLPIGKRWLAALTRFKASNKDFSEILEWVIKGPSAAKKLSSAQLVDLPTEGVYGVWSFLMEDGDEWLAHLGISRSADNDERKGDGWAKIWAAGSNYNQESGAGLILNRGRSIPHYLNKEWKEKGLPALLPVFGWSNDYFATPHILFRYAEPERTWLSALGAPSTLSSIQRRPLAGSLLLVSTVPATYSFVPGAINQVPDDTAKAQPTKADKAPEIDTSGPSAEHLQKAPEVEEPSFKANVDEEGKLKPVELPIDVQLPTTGKDQNASLDEDGKLVSNEEKTADAPLTLKKKKDGTSGADPIGDSE